MATIQSSRFDIIRTLGSGGMGVVYEATEKTTGRRVALKSVHQSTGQNVYRIKQEFRSLADIEHDHLVRFLQLYEEQGQWFICMELIEGKEFDAYIGGFAKTTDPSITQTADGATFEDEDSSRKRGAESKSAGQPLVPSREASLRTCLGQVVLALSHLHELGRVHCDLKPSNILITGEGRAVVLDFGLTRTIAEEGPADTRKRVEGTIGYMAPEQVRGETPSPATDFYALGVMLYEALTGRRPFQGSDVQVMAEKQRRYPRAPHLDLPNLPTDLSELCRQLLSPFPGERPTAGNILRTLGSREESSPKLHSSILRTRDQFVGRQAELERLASTAREQAHQMRGVLLRGEPGIGKSALARAFLKTKEQEALVFSSRCHEQENVPLKALDGIVDGLSRYLLSLSEVDTALLLPTDVSPLVEVFPVLSRVPIVARLVKKSAPQGLSDEMRHRAALILRQLLQAIAREEYIFLFIDDLQWADASSLEFLSALIHENDVLPCFFLATSRPVSETKSDPFSRLSKMSSTWSSNMEVWTLRGLARDEVKTLLHSTAIGNVSAERTQSLIDESEGHPLLLKEMVRYLITEGAEAKHPVSLAHALEHRIGRLGQRERTVLETVCLAGAPLNLAATAASLGLPIIDCELSVHRLRGGQLLRLDEREEEKVLEPYHDRIRETVEATFAQRPQARLAVHRSLGQALLSLKSAGRRGSTIFAIVGNLNRTIEELNSESERTELARLNFEAGRRAIEATAYSQAQEYIDCGLTLLDSNSWVDEFELTFELHLDRMFALFLSGQHAAAERAFVPLAEHATDEKDIARAFEILIKLQQCRGDDEGSLLSMRRGLARLGHSFPNRPGKLAVVWEMTKMNRTLARLDLRRLVEAPLTDSATAVGKQRLFLGAFGAAFRSDPNAMVLLGIRSLCSVADEGLSEVGDFGFLSAGLLQVGVSKDFVGARRSIEVAEQLYERFGEQSSTATTRALMGGFVGPFVTPYPQCETWLDEGYQAGLRQGDGLMTYCCLVLKSGLRASYGSSLDELLDVASRCEMENTRRGIRNWAACGQVAKLQCQAMAQRTENPLLALVPLRDELGQQDSLAGFLFHQALAEMNNLLGNREQAMEAAERTIGLKHQVFATMGEVTAIFHHGLAASRLWPQKSGRERRKLQRVVRQSIKRLKTWADVCPENQGPYYACLLAVDAASYARKEADELFDEAIETAKKHGQLKQEALCLRLHAEWLLSREPVRARQQLQSASGAYERYGSHSMVQFLAGMGEG